MRHIGTRRQEISMLHGRVDLKRNRVGFLTLSLAAGLLACGGLVPPSSSAPPPTTTTTTGAAATYHPINPDGENEKAGQLRAQASGLDPWFQVLHPELMGSSG
jgi:hypothetical protein